MKGITSNVSYIPNRVNVGVIKDGKNSILIDSGLDADSGRKILEILQNHNLSPSSIINTHSHADHCGGNAYIKEKTGATIYAPEIEAAIIQYPYLEPLYLFSGANPIKELRNKFLLAPSSQVDYVIKEYEKKLFNKLEIVQLRGHSPNQIGVGVENVLFCADSIFSKDVLEKYKIPFCVNVNKQKETLNFLRDSNYSFYIPCHAEPTNDIIDLVDVNLRTINDVEMSVLETLNEKKTTEQILMELCNHYKIEMNNAQQYYLMNTTIMAYLSSLHESQKLKLRIKENSLYWEKI